MSIKGPRLDCGPDFLDAALIDSCRQFSRALFSLAVTVDQIPGIASRQKGKRHQFFYHVNDSIIVAEGFMRPSSSNSCHALAIEEGLGIVSIRIQRPEIRI